MSHVTVGPPLPIDKNADDDVDEKPFCSVSVTRFYDEKSSSSVRIKLTEVGAWRLMVKLVEFLDQYGEGVGRG